MKEIEEDQWRLFFINKFFNIKFAHKNRPLEKKKLKELHSLNENMNKVIEILIKFNIKKKKYSENILI